MSSLTILKFYESLSIMSVESWNEEFYPISAKDLVNDEKLSHIHPDEVAIKCAEHSLQKWKGLLPVNLTKHNVTRNDKGFISICSNSCALCEEYFNYQDKHTDYQSECIDCPLFQYLGQRCDIDTDKTSSPYLKFIERHNPKPMIKALKGALKMLKERKSV